MALDESTRNEPRTRTAPMLISLLLRGDWVLFALIIIALVLSLSFHEFGHAFVAKLYGDDTAERMGRLTLNPLAHIDPMGLLMVIMVGFGYAKPVPTNPANFRSRAASPMVAFAGPLMNLLLAFAMINLFSIGTQFDWGFFARREVQTFFIFMAQINLVLMLFNLIPLGPLDGHYILPYFLPRHLARRYEDFNAAYGSYALLGLILLSVVGVPVFRIVFSVGHFLIPLLRVV